MKRCNSIEEYNEAFRKQFKDNWEAEVRHCQNWLDGHHSYFKVGWLENCNDENVVKDKLAYANEMLNNIDYYVQRHSYSYKKPKAQKDNDLSFVGHGQGWAHSSQIRVPRLKRKMFPDLVGMKTIPRRSSCYTREADGEVCQQIQHKSTIKLKKKKH